MNYFRKQNADVKTGWLDTEIDTGTGLLEMTRIQPHTVELGQNIGSISDSQGLLCISGHENGEREWSVVRQPTPHQAPTGK
jgi:hypothetical protein